MTVESLQNKLESLGDLPTVSIIVLNYNGKKYLDNCFQSIAKIVYPKNKYEVLLVDNNSSDGSGLYVQAKYPSVKIIRLTHNHGFTGGNNIGVSYATGKYVVLLNNDVTVDEKWLLELIRTVEKNPGAIITSKSLLAKDHSVIDYDGSKMTILGRGFTVNVGQKDKRCQNSPKFVVQPYGASMLVEKSIFRRIGQFDENYFTSLEDLDLGLRAWLCGYKVIYNPQSVFYHEVGGTCGLGTQQKDIIIFHSTKNSYMNVLKNFDKVHILFAVPLSLLFYATMFARLVKAGRLTGARLIISSHLWVVRNIGVILTKRRAIDKKRMTSHKVLFQADFLASFQEMIGIRPYLNRK